MCIPSGKGKPLEEGLFKQENDKIDFLFWEVGLECCVDNVWTRQGDSQEAFGEAVVLGVGDLLGDGGKEETGAIPLCLSRGKEWLFSP